MEQTFSKVQGHFVVLHHEMFALALPRSSFSDFLRNLQSMPMCIISSLGLWALLFVSYSIKNFRGHSMALKLLAKYWHKWCPQATLKD
jgi:hypothetical protein